MSGLLVLNHQQKGESFQGADIVEFFSTPSTSSRQASSMDSTSTLAVSSVPNGSGQAGQAGSPAPRSSIIPSKTTIPTVSATPLVTATSTRTPIISTRTTLTPAPSISTLSSPSPSPSQTYHPTPSLTPTSTSTPTFTPTPKLTPTPSETPNNSSISNILISEVQVGGVDAGDEFIELYNPNNSEIDISGWSIQYLSGSSTSVDKTVKKNFEAGNKISAKGFFLIARAKNSSGNDGYTGSVIPDLDHRSFSLSGASSGGKIFLVSDAVKIDSLTDANIVDSLDYSFLVPENGKSLERKSDGSFELNNNPSPQNTSSL